MSEWREEKVRSNLLALASTVKEQLPPGWGFVVLAFPFGAGERMNYIFEGERADIERAMQEFMELSKKELLFRAADALERPETKAYMQQWVESLIAELRKAAQ